MFTDQEQIKLHKIFPAYKVKYHCLSTVSHLMFFLTSSMIEPHGNNNAKSIVLPGHNIQLDQPRRHLKEKGKLLISFPIFTGVYKVLSTLYIGMKIEYFGNLIIT